MRVSLLLCLIPKNALLLLAAPFCDVSFIFYSIVNAAHCVHEKKTDSVRSRSPLAHAKPIFFVSYVKIFFVFSHFIRRAAQVQPMSGRDRSSSNRNGIGIHVRCHQFSLEKRQNGMRMRETQTARDINFKTKKWKLSAITCSRERKNGVDFDSPDFQSFHSASLHEPFNRCSDVSMYCNFILFPSMFTYISLKKHKVKNDEWKSESRPLYHNCYVTMCPIRQEKCNT